MAGGSGNQLQAKTYEMLPLGSIKPLGYLKQQLRFRQTGYPAYR